MALVEADLKKDIKDMLGKDKKEDWAEKDFAEGLMEAYASYAEEAEDISKDKILGSLNTSAAANTLETALKQVKIEGITKDPDTGIVKATLTNDGAALMLGTALGTALMSVWTGVKFAVTAPGVFGTSAFTASETLAIVSVPGLALSAAIAELPHTDDLEKAAKAWSEPMDKFTKTVQVTITGMILVPGAAPVVGPPITAPIT
jgi:hypothetical protein